VRHIIEMHGGVVLAESAGEGQGSTFRVTLPMMIVHPGAPTPRTREHPLAEHNLKLEALGDLNGVHVLAVDDEEDSLGLLRTVLEAAGARVTTASSGATALATLEIATPDVLVADIGMPEMDGFELIKRIRALPKADVRDVPAAALTAFARSEDRTRALRHGFEMHLAKPVDPGELVASVATLVRRSRTSKA
jgi:CheY-like chemotaxis protein